MGPQYSKGLRETGPILTPFQGGNPIGHSPGTSENYLEASLMHSP